MRAVSPASSGALRTARIARGRVPFFACPKKGTKERAPPRRRPSGKPWPGPLRPGRPEATSCRGGTERALHGPFTRSPQPRPWRLQGGSGNPSFSVVKGCPENLRQVNLFCAEEYRLAPVFCPAGVAPWRVPPLPGYSGCVLILALLRPRP